MALWSRLIAKRRSMYSAPLFHGATGSVDDLLVCGIALAAVLLVVFLLGLGQPNSATPAKRPRKDKLKTK